VAMHDKTHAIAGKGDLTRSQGTSFGGVCGKMLAGANTFAVLKSSQGRSTSNLHMTHIISRMQTRTQASPANAHPSFTSSIWHQDQAAERGVCISCACRACCGQSFQSCADSRQCARVDIPKDMIIITQHRCGQRTPH